MWFFGKFNILLLLIIVSFICRQIILQSFWQIEDYHKKVYGNYKEVYLSLMYFFVFWYLKAWFFFDFVLCNQNNRRLKLRWTFWLFCVSKQNLNLVHSWNTSKLYYYLCLLIIAWFYFDILASQEKMLKKVLQFVQ